MQITGNNELAGKYRFMLLTILTARELYGLRRSVDKHELFSIFLDAVSDQYDFMAQYVEKS